MSRAWVPIPGWEGRYDVSDDGRVRSWITRGGPCPRLLRDWADKDGYRKVGLRRDGKTHYLFVHGLVALAFRGSRPDGTQVRHLNGRNTDNRVTNLVYGTPSENVQDSIDHGTHDNGRRALTHCPANHPYDAENTRVGPQGHRWCRACKRIRDAADRERRRSSTALSQLVTSSPSKD